MPFCSTVSSACASITGPNQTAFFWHTSAILLPWRLKAGYPVAVTKMDITLPVRTAHHLFTMTALLCFLLFVSFDSALSTLITSPHTSVALTIAVSVVCVIIFLGLCVFYARRELNGWAYVIAALCAILVLLFGGVLIGLTVVGGLVSSKLSYEWALLIMLLLGPPFLLYPVRILIDFRRLLRARYDLANTSPISLANAVSKLFRRTRSSVSSFHMPTNPGRTFIYSLLTVIVSPIISLRPPIGFFAYPILFLLAAQVRRNYVLPANEVLKLDTRYPILFLRPFGADHVGLWGKGIIGKFRTKTIDEAIKRFAERLGPFVAIANPKTTLPRLGAAQSYFTDDTWQDAISRWVDMAQMIVMVAGRTAGVRWELDHIFSNQADHKLVIFFPPPMRKHPSIGTQWLNDHFSHTRYAADLAEVDTRKIIAMCFRDDGLFVVETARIAWQEVDYLVAFQALIFAMHASVSTIRSDTGPECASAATGFGPQRRKANT